MQVVYESSVLIVFVVRLRMDKLGDKPDIHERGRNDVSDAISMIIQLTLGYDYPFIIQI